ncbi:hypothetical protein QYE76_060290 [Lolium multiflorum]|uniref:DUF8039 domain-containing protein n=1 Tax=Lolium multiflorum TaxID=4521 RepID=A0AAD8W582_LOLMU|nr:hypothetical protein QYE76_060290 [Lolium multiflorum]
MENELRARGIRPGTEGWDPRAKSWWYGHGGSLNPETGECVYRGKIIKPTEKLIEAMRDAQEGKIKFNRENDALTKALGNPEHGGRVRGMGHIPWKIGFPQNDDPYGYRSRKRKMDRDADVVARLASEMDVMKKTVSVLVAERDASRAQHEDHPMDLGSQQQRRSSVASTEAPPAGAPTIEITAPEPLVVEITAPEPPRYPVDDIKEMKACHLYYPIGNMSMKVAIGSALPPGALHHNNPIPDGYARVTVEDIVQGFEDLDIDIATPEGATRLGDVKRQFILWQKKFIKFPGEAPRQTSPPPSGGGGGGGGGGGSPTPPSRQPTPSPNSPPAGKQTPPPSPRPAGDQTPPPNPPPAKKQRQSWVINPEPYVPATTKIPEPSLKPLTPRPWELSVEQNAAVVAAQHEKWQADCKKKREPEPKQVFSEKEKSWAKSFLNTPSQAAKNLPDDYERELRSQALAVGGKQVAQLGEQSKQSIAPLIVKAAGPEDDAPDVIAAAAAQGLTVARAKEQAADLGLTLRAALGLDDVAMKDVVFAYVKDGPLVEPAQEEDLPRQMKGLLNCELFQLFNLRELDKSIISCYVLEDLTKGYSRLCGAENTREKRALRRAGIRRGNSLPEGEIDAIAIVIERDIISIIIIISTIYTAITTAAPRHRCNNSGISMNEVRKKLFTISLSGKAAHWYKLLKNGDSIDWEDIVPLFYSKFYPPNKTLLDTSCSGSFTRKNEEFKRDLLDRIQENTEGWENDKDRESGIIYDYKCIEAFMDTDKFRNMSATYGLDSQVVANLYKAFASHYELPKKNFDKYHEPYKDKVDSSVNKCVVIETVDNVIPEAYIEKTPFPAKMKEYSVISSAVNKSEKKPKEPEEQIKIEPAVAIVKDLVTENVEDGHIIFCEDASNIVSHPNKPKQVSVPMLSVRIGDHCYYGLCDIGASVSAIPYELYTEIMHEIGSCELEDIDVVIHLANRETISPIGIVRDVEVLCGKIKYPADFLVLGSAASDHCPIIFGRPFLNTCGAIIDCKKEKILTRFAGEPYEFNFSKFTKTPYKADLPSNDFKMEQCASIVLVPNNPLQQHLENSESEAFRKERDELEEIFLRQPILKHDLPVEDLGTTPPPKEDPVFDLKPLPDNLKYAHIDDKKIYPVIISSKLSEIEEERNPSKEIFSELDETFAQGPIFARSFQKTEEITKWGHEAARGVAGAAQALAAPTYPLGPSSAGGTFMSITLGAATKLLDDMMINYSEWHTERAPQGKKVNSVEETSSLSDKIDVIMSMLVNGRSNVDPNNVPLASLVAQEENVDVNFIKNNNFNNNAYRNNSGNNYRPYPSANGNGYGNSYGNSYNNNRSVPSGLEAMLKEFISTQTAFNKSVEEKLDKIDTIASRVDRLASDVNLLKLKVMPNNDIDNKITTTANAIQVRINENIRLMAELRARWDREENEKLAKENNVAKVWTITTTSNANSPHVAAPPTINGNIIGVGNVSTPSAKRTKLPEIAKTAETACDKTAEIFSNLGNNDPIAVAHNDLDFDDCHISEVIKFLQKLAKSPNASAINLAFTKHITNALIKAREEKLKLETSIPRKLEDGWEPIIKMKFNDFECNALCDLGASISVMPKKIYDMLDLPPLKNCYLDVNLADNVKKKPLGRIDNVHITVNNNLVPVDFVVLDIECNASCPIVLGRPFLRTVGAVIDMREGSYFCTKLPEDRRDNEVGPRGSRRVAGAAQALAAPTYPRAPRVAPALTLRLLKASVAKPPVPRATIRKTFRDAAANPISGIQEIASDTCRRGDSSPGGLYTAMVASGVMSE